MLGIFDGRTSFVNVCHFDAPSVCMSISLLFSTLINPLKVLSIVTKSEIASAIVIIADWSVPIQMIMIGPSAILGRALSTTI